MKYWILLLLISGSAVAQVGSLSLDPACPACPPADQKTKDETFDRYGNTFLVGYQALNTWVPGKFTGSYSRNFSSVYSMEFEFGTSQKELDVNGVDLGDIQEDRYSLFLKRFFGRSFNISLGPYWNEVNFELGNQIRDVNGEIVQGTIDVITYGLGVGIGNRWQLENGLTIGIDWIRVNQPLGAYSVNEQILSTLSEENKDDVKRTGRLFRTAPAITYFGLNVGYSF